MLPEEESMESVQEKLQTIRKNVRVDAVKGQRAYILAEPDAGAGLAQEDLLGVLKQLMGSGAFPCLCTCKAVRFDLTKCRELIHW